MTSEKERALDFLTRTAQGIAQMFGASCETLIHDMLEPGHPIVAIFNSHVSGRNIGSVMDIYGNTSEPSSGNCVFAFGKDYINNQVITKKGRFIKSSTFNYKSDDYHYALGINFDYTSITGTSRLLAELSSADVDLNAAIMRETENQLEEIFESALASFDKPLAEMNKNDRLKLIVVLMQKKAFSYQKSVAYIAEKLNVSRFTIYKYCHEVEANSK